MSIKEMALKAYPPMAYPLSEKDDDWDYNEQYRDCTSMVQMPLYKERRRQMTIEEMAEMEFPIKSWEERRAGNDCRRIYCMGANAVLEEIEKALKQAKLYSDLSCKSRLYDDLVNLVEQLKK